MMHTSKRHGLKSDQEQNIMIHFIHAESKRKFYTFFFVISLTLVSCDPMYNVYNGTKYPQTSLKCYATLASNNQRTIICPEDRMNYCVKEVISTANKVSLRKTCESSSYFPNKEWNVKMGECVYRKCSATCPMKYKTYVDVDGEEVLFESFSHCCNSTLCNSSKSHENLILLTKSMILFWLSLIAFG